MIFKILLVLCMAREWGAVGMKLEPHARPAKAIVATYEPDREIAGSPPAGAPPNIEAIVDRLETVEEEREWQKFRNVWIEPSGNQTPTSLPTVPTPVALSRHPRAHKHESTTPRGSWLFMTIDTSDLAKLLIEKAGRTRLEDRRLDVPKVVELVKNLTNDYDNENLVGKFNKTLRQMDLPTCKFSNAECLQSLFSIVVFILFVVFLLEG